MWFSPSYLVTDLDVLTSFSAYCTLNRAFCAVASLPSLMEMLVFCVAYPLVRSAEKYLLISILYPLARLTLRGGGAGQAVLTNAAAGAQTERARNIIVNGAYVANFHSVTMTG